MSPRPRCATDKIRTSVQFFLLCHRYFQKNGPFAIWLWAWELGGTQRAWWHPESLGNVHAGVRSIWMNSRQSVLCCRAYQVTWGCIFTTQPLAVCSCAGESQNKDMCWSSVGGGYVGWVTPEGGHQDCWPCWDNPTLPWCWGCLSTRAALRGHNKKLISDGSGKP